MEMEDGAGRERMLRLALLISMACGLLLRGLQYASGRALWLDEAALSATLLRPGWGSLVHPYAYGQTAPFGFMLLQKLAVSLLGSGEHALRLFPFLAGVATLALFPGVARRYVSRGAAVLAVALLAFAPYLIYYGGEAKQYAFDGLAAVLVLGCVAPLLESSAARQRDLLWLALAGVVLVWFSQPVIFTLAGAGVVLLLGALRRRDRELTLRLLPIGAAWLASFAGSYGLTRALISDPQYLHDFWRAGFMPPLTGALGDPLWLPRSLLHVFREPLGVYGSQDAWTSRLQTGVGMLAFVAGVIALWRLARVRLAVLLLPLAITVAAAILQFYPLGANYPTAGRVLIFMLPALVLVIGQGVAWLGGLRPRLGSGALAGVVVLALLGPSLGYGFLAVPHMRDEIKPLLSYAAEHRQPGDLLYVHYRALPSFRYYAPRYGWQGPAVVEGACARLRPGEYLNQLGALRGHSRVWVLFVDGKAAGNYDEREFLSLFLDHIGNKLDGQLASGAWLYLYDLSPQNLRPGTFRGRAAAPPRRYDAALDCRGPWAR
jgi:uncharacterized membrane protein